MKHILFTICCCFIFCGCNLFSTYDIGCDWYQTYEIQKNANDTMLSVSCNCEPELEQIDFSTGDDATYFSTLTNLTYSGCEEAILFPDMTNLRSLGYSPLEIDASIGTAVNLQHLSLSGTIPNNRRRMVITQYPDELLNATHLNTISISGRCLPSFPTGMVNYTELKKLNISENPCLNNLNSLPPSLEEIIILNCEELSDASFLNSNLSKVKKLEVERIGSVTIPSTIGGLDSIEEMHFSYFEIQSLPAELGQLTTLKKLSFETNNLSSIPYLSQLSELKELTISTQPLTEIGDWIENMPKLRELHVILTQTNQISDKIGALSELSYLDLASNQLSSLPSSIVQCSNIGILFLSSNRFTTFPMEIIELTNLGSLYLGGNQISSIPDEIGQLSNLSNLDLSYNNLTSLPANIANLKDHLKYLNLSDNNFSEAAKAEIIGWLPDTRITF